MTRLCVPCARLVEGERCPTCGAESRPLDDTALDAAFRARLDREISRWVLDGRIDPGQATRLRVVSPVVAPATAVETEAPAPVVVDAAPHAAEPTLDPALDAATALAPDAPVDHLDAIAALDLAPPAGADPGGRFTALLARNLWWLLGGALVLGGSVLGVREAWRALEGPWRPLLVSAAVCVYHLFFLGLGVLTGRRSAESGRVLTAVALALLPVALGPTLALGGAAPLMGTLAGLGVLGLGALTAAIAARRFDDLRPITLRLAVLTPLAIAVFAARLDDPGPLVALLAPLGLLAVGAEASPFVGGPVARALALAALATLWFLVPALRGGGPAALLAVTAGGALALSARGMPAAWRPAALGLLGLACVAVGAFRGVVVAHPAFGGPLSALLAPLLGISVFAALAPDRPRTWHVLLPLAAGTLFVLQQRLLPVPLVAAALAPGLTALALAALQPDFRGRSTWFAALVATAALLLTLPPESGPAALLIGLPLAAALHVAAHRRARSAAPALCMTFAALTGALGGLATGPDALLAALPWLPLPVLPFALGLAGLGWRPRGPHTQALSVVAVAGLVLALLGVPRAPEAWQALGVAAALTALFSRERRVLFDAGLVLVVVAHDLWPGHAAFERMTTAPGAALAVLALSALGTARLEGFGFAALVGLLLPAAATFAFLDAPTDDLRPLALLTAAPFLVLPLLAFLGPGAARWGARGHPLTLALIFGGAVVLALVNRAGRPLPPPDQALRYTLVGVALFAAGRTLQGRFAGWSAALGRPEGGNGWSRVIDASVLALASLLVIKGVLTGFGLFTPPMFAAGAGLLLALLATGAERTFLAYAAAPLLALGAFLALYPVDMDTMSAALATTLLCAALQAALPALMRERLGPVPPALGRAFGLLVPLTLAGALPAAANALDPRLVGVALFATAMTALAQAPRRAAWLLGATLASAALVASSTAGLATPYGGPGLAAAAALAFVVSVRLGRAAAFVSPAHLGIVAWALSLLSLPLALAGGVRLEPGRALERLADAAGLGVVVLPTGAPLLALALGSIALGLFARAALDPTAGALRRAGLLAIAALLVARPLVEAPVLAPAHLLLAVGLHLALRRAPEHRKPLALPREVALICVYLLATLVSFAGLSSDALAGKAALVALAGVAVFGVGRALAERSGVGALHAQLAVVAAYGVFRSLFAPALASAWDALAALALAFALVGVAVAARRAGAAPVAATVRRFSALLPIAAQALAAVDAGPLGDSGDAVAAGGAVVYLAMAVAERSRAFGALATLAAQLAFVLWSRDQDPGLLPVAAVLPGALGATMLVLAQLYAERLGPAGRRTTRLLGGLLLFVPGALTLVSRLGGDDARFALLFGLLCLVGVLAGTLLRVRAYLFLGGLFLLLDIGAHVAHAGLQDQRVGFALMTVLGLGILGTMAAVTLRREAAQRLARRLADTLRTWD